MGKATIVPYPFIARTRTIKYIPRRNYTCSEPSGRSAHCPACSEHNRTVEHYLLQCPSCAHERWTLKRDIDDELSLASLLANEKAVLHLANYIDATHWLTYKVSKSD
jgi:hypothetical protein